MADPLEFEDGYQPGLLSPFGLARLASKLTPYGLARIMMHPRKQVDDTVAGLRGIGHVLTAPQRAVTGELGDPIQEGNDFALMMAGGGSMIPEKVATAGATGDALGTFLGPRGARNLKLAGIKGPQEAMDLAHSLEMQGMKPGEIWEQTGKHLKGTPFRGVHRGLDGKLRVELSDYQGGEMRPEGVQKAVDPFHPIAGEDLDTLSKKYQTWLDEQKLPQLDTDELIGDAGHVPNNPRYDELNKIARERDLTPDEQSELGHLDANPPERPDDYFELTPEQEKVARDFSSKFWLLDEKINGARRGAGWLPPSSMAVKDVLDHPLLYKAYPDLGEMPLTVADKVGDSATTTGEFSPGGSVFNDKISLRRDQIDPDEPFANSTLLHELQHGIQAREGMHPGANPEDVGYDKYRRSAGEVEARNVGTRNEHEIFESERVGEPPWQTADVKPGRQIVDFDRLYSNKSDELMALPILQDQFVKDRPGLVKSIEKLVRLREAGAMDRFNQIKKAMYDQARHTDYLRQRNEFKYGRETGRPPDDSQVNTKRIVEEVLNKLFPTGYQAPTLKNQLRASLAEEPKGLGGLKPSETGLSNLGFKPRVIKGGLDRDWVTQDYPGVNELAAQPDVLAEATRMRTEGHKQGVKNTDLAWLTQAKRKLAMRQAGLMSGEDLHDFAVKAGLDPKKVEDAYRTQHQSLQQMSPSDFKAWAVKNLKKPLDDTTLFANKAPKSMSLLVTQAVMGTPAERAAAREILEKTPDGMRRVRQYEADVKKGESQPPIDRTPDPKLVAQADKLEKMGVDEDKILNMTGMMRGEGGAWEYDEYHPQFKDFDWDNFHLSMEGLSRHLKKPKKTGLSRLKKDKK